MSRRTIVAAPIACMLAIGCAGSTRSGAGPSGGGDVAEAQPRGNVDEVGVGADEDQSTADIAEHHRHHHHGGFAMFIALSLDTLNLSPEQTATVERIRDDLRAKMQPARDAEKTVLNTLADGIAAGALDQAKLDAEVDQLKTAAAGIHDAIADSLNALHATLTPAQRAALVDKLEAHFEVWHHANAPHEGAERDKQGGHLARLQRQLDLSQDQVEKIRANFKASMSGAHKFDRSEAEEHMKAFGAAFASDSFDAKTIKTGGALNANMAVWGIKRTVRVYEAALPVLTAEQRTKLADEIRRHANYRPDNKS